MKIIKHADCKFGDKCPLIGKEAKIEETIPAMGEEPEWYWVRVDGMQHKFRKGDLE